MALGRQGERRGDLVVTWEEMPRSPSHILSDRLQGVLIDAGFDAFAETTCNRIMACRAVHAHFSVMPPSTTSSIPVTYRDSSEARNRAA